MARGVRKPRNYKAEYAKRIERALSKGKTRQQARGHKAHEHIERRERERENEGVSSGERRAIERFFDRFDPKEIKGVEVEQMLDWVRENGYTTFQNYRKTWDSIRRDYKRGVVVGSLSALEGLSIGLELPGVNWLYYH